MTTIRQSIHIDAPRETVFRVVTNPDNWVQYVSSLSSVTDLSSEACEPGTTFRWEYRMFGLTFRGAGEVKENVPNESFAMQMKGGVPTSERYQMTDAEAGGTDLTVEIVYTLPSRVLDRVASSSLAEGLNQREATSVLEKIELLCTSA